MLCRLFDGRMYRSLVFPRYDDDYSNNYYVTQEDDDDDDNEGSSNYNNEIGLDKFRVYWNVPTFQCHKHGYNFTEVSEWGIRQNIGDDFRGDQISLLYDPGLFPALLPSGGGGSRSDYVIRNGGVPHEGNLTKHLELFTRDLITKLVPDSSFSGKLNLYSIVISSLIILTRVS